MRWTFEITESWRISWEAILSNRLRSALTTLGIVVGIVAVTLMAMAIEGINIAFRNSVSTLGANTLYVQRIPWMRMTYQDWKRFQARPPVDLTQARALERRLVNAVAFAPMTEARLAVRYKDRSLTGISVLGTTESYLLTAGLSVTDGRFLSSQEVEGGRPVCVLGSMVASNLFQNESPIGARVRIQGEAVEVIGVLDKRGTFMGGFNFDNQVVVPAKLFTSAFVWDPDFAIQVKASSVGALQELIEEVRGAMRLVRRVEPTEEDNFAINQQQSIIDSFGRVSAVVGSVGFFISGLSLFVGGIGIMNIMFVSVAERTREIGIRKAIGARRRTILIQFLTEAATICFMAGALGVGIAWLISLALSRSLPVSMSFNVAGIALGVSVAVGIVSGFLPAWRAARLNPVDALRNE